MAEQHRTLGDDSDDREQYTRLWNRTVSTLTEAVRLSHPLHGPMDFADFLASALRAVAGNVGSVQRITAGRPLSSESELVNALVQGAVGSRTTAEELAAYRTEPVVVRLNVAQLLDHARFKATDEERAAIPLALYEAIDALLDPWNSGFEPTDEQLGTRAVAEAELRKRYGEAFKNFAQRFRTAVLDAAEAINGLSQPVRVKTDANAAPADWWEEGLVNSYQYQAEDALAMQLWQTAWERVGLPVDDEG